MMFGLWLSWVIIASAIVMSVLASWHWYDANRDATSVINDRREAVRQQALGGVRRSWIWLAASAFWLWYGYHVLDPTEASQHGRPLALLVLWLEIIDIWTQRWTRLQVSMAVDGETVQRHRELMTALAENTAVTISASVMAKDAYQAANATNAKIADLNARLIEQGDRAVSVAEDVAHKAEETAATVAQKAEAVATRIASNVDKKLDKLLEQK